MSLNPVFEAAIAGMAPPKRAANDAAETLQAYEAQAQARCMGMLKGGACIKAEPCAGACCLATEAAKPSSPFSCRPLTDAERERTQAEAEEARAEEVDRAEFDAHPERFR